ncbi:MAG: hypothetical protein ACI4IR_03770 [Eubacterium sp.]
MRLAIIGSRNLSVSNLEKYMPSGVSEIVSGGARGIDTCAKEYAMENDLILTEFLPEYSKYGRIAPLVRNDLIIDYADEVIAFWDGKSRGTKYVIEKCKSKNKKLTVIRCDDEFRLVGLNNSDDLL